MTGWRGMRRRRSGARTHGGAGALACARRGLPAALLALAAAPAAAGEAAPAAGSGLTVSILDLAEAPALAPPPPAEARRPAWRTSFGAERRTEPEVKPETAAGSGLLAAVAGSDAVLIQGVKAAAPLRRLFPPRTWRLIVSKRLVAPLDPAGAGPAERPAATAIAVKARRDLRVTARAYALRLDDPPPGGPEAALPAAATAVRLMDRGRAVWLASVALPSACLGAASAACPARDGLESWRAARRAAGEATLIGGRLAGHSAAGAETTDAPAACAAHAILSDLAAHTVPPAGGTAPPEDGSGCISVIRLAD